MEFFRAWFRRFFPAPAVEPLPSGPPIPRPVSSAGPDPATESSIATDYLSLLNADRARLGLPALELDPDLCAFSQNWANKQAEADRLGHGDFFGRFGAAYPNRSGAENVAGWNADPLSTYVQWGTSPEHAANMYGPYRLAGVGRAKAASGRFYWCADFVN